MRIHIVGAGPTGLTVAWELAKLKKHQILVYDKKPGPGGSWWEPTSERRNLHAARAAFKNGWVNTTDLFREMGIKWSDVFEPLQKTLPEGSLFSALDYCALAYLAIRILMSPDTYKHVSIKDALGKELSEKGQKTLEHLTYQIDGIPWDVMTAYELIRTFDFTALSKIETQKMSGDKMGHLMQKALEKVGVEFFFNSELSKLVYGKGDDSFKAYFSEDPIEDGLLILCPDAGPAKKLVGDNWGPDAKDILTKGTYESVTIMLYYNTELPPLPSGLVISMNTELGMLAHALSDNKTIVVSLLKKPPKDLDPDQLSEEVVKQLKGVPGMPKLPQLASHAIGWGSRWVQGGWTHTQTGHTYSTLGTLPFFGKNKKVALCGMMSERSTPYSCMEAAIEVGRSFCSKNFGTPKPRKPWTVSKLILVIIILWVALTVKSSGKPAQALTR